MKTPPLTEIVPHLAPSSAVVDATGDLHLADHARVNQVESDDHPFARRGEIDRNDPILRNQIVDLSIDQRRRSADKAHLARLVFGFHHIAPSSASAICNLTNRCSSSAANSCPLTTPHALTPPPSPPSTPPPNNPIS